MPCKNFHVPGQYLYKPCKTFVYCWENKYISRLKNPLTSWARNHKSLCALGQDLHAPGMQASLNVEPWLCMGPLSWPSGNVKPKALALCLELSLSGKKAKQFTTQKYIHIFCHFSTPGLNTGCGPCSWILSSRKTMTYLSYSQFMAADALEMLGTRASATMVLTLLPEYSVFSTSRDNYVLVAANSNHLWSCFSDQI